MKNEKGFVLILSGITILTVFILVGALFSSLISHTSLISGQKDAIQAYNSAEAGLARGIIQLRNGGATATNPINSALSGGTYGTYSVVFTPVTVPPGAVPCFIINSTGTYGGARRTLTLEVSQETMAQWVFLANNQHLSPFVDYAWFYDGDYIDGPVHINEYLDVWGDPVFDGHVDLGKTINYFPDGTSNPLFNQGVSFNTPDVPVPSAAAVLSLIEVAALSSGGLTFLGDTTIYFTGDGRMQVTNIITYPPSFPYPGGRATLDLPANGAIYVRGGTWGGIPDQTSGRLTISGELSGKVTIGAEGDITIADNLIYAGPRDNKGLPMSPDNMLGLVTAGDVYISSTAPGNLKIDAYIAAPEGTFKRLSTLSTDQGLLTIYGGITQNAIGKVGGPTDSGRWPGVFPGYHKSYHHDQRMESESPLYFPALTDADGRVRWIKKRWQGR